MKLSERMRGKRGWVSDEMVEEWADEVAVLESSLAEAREEIEGLKETIRRIGVQTEIPLAVFSRDRALRCLRATREEIKKAFKAGEDEKS